MTGAVEIQTEDKPFWKLKSAVLVYQGTRRDTFGNDGPVGVGAYATVHDVVSKGGRLELAAGVPATKEACATLARELGAAATLSGFVPPSMLYLGARCVAWWRAPAPATMHFDTTKQAAGDQRESKKHAARIGKRGERLAQPGLVFVVTTGNWYVYAVKGAGRPGPETEIWRAPYFNVWATGRICTGNVRLPESLSTHALEEYERAFFGSEFTHPNVNPRERLVRHPDGSYAFWRDQIKARPEVFPEASLVPTKHTLLKLIAQIEKGKIDHD